MLLVKNSFKIAIRENGRITEPAFDEDISFSCIKYPDYFQVDVFNVSEDKLSKLKEKYIWITEETIEIDGSVL